MKKSQDVKQLRIGHLLSWLHPYSIIPKLWLTFLYLGV